MIKLLDKQLSILCPLLVPMQLELQEQRPTAGPLWLHNLPGQILEEFYRICGCSKLREKYALVWRRSTRTCFLVCTTVSLLEVTLNYGDGNPYARAIRFHAITLLQSQAIT